MENFCIVSVIIPVYNVAAYLTDSLDSVIHQSYENIEIIIIDDGSTDESGRICDEYAKADNRIRVVHQENMGLSAARNAGLDMVTGDAIVFLDSDDNYHRDYVRLMTEAMINEGADLVLCKYSLHRSTGRMRQTGREKTYPSSKSQTYNRVHALQALADGTIDHVAWNKLYRKNLWESIRYPIGQVYEDLYTTFQVINLCNKLCVLDKPLYLKRKREGSITEIWTKKNIEDWLIARSHFECFVNDNIPEIFTQYQAFQLRRSRLCRMVSCYVRYSWENGDSEQYSRILRARIVDMGKAIGVGKCDIRVRLSYWMVCSCPLALRASSFFYYLIRRYSRNN